MDDGGKQNRGARAQKTTWGEDAVVAHFSAASGQHVLEEAFEKFDSGDGGTLDELSFVVAIAERDVSVANRFDAAVGDGNAKHIPAEIFQNLVARTGMPGVNHPGFCPDRGRDALKQASLIERGTHLGAKDQRQGSNRNQKGRIFRSNPACTVQGKASGGDEHVNVRMIEHGPGPGVQDGENPGARAEITRIPSQLLKGIGGGFHQKSVKLFRVRPGNGVQFVRQGEGQQVIGARRQTKPLPGNPAAGLILVTLWATAIAAGMIGVDFPLAVVALVKVASKERRSTVLDIG